MSASSRRELGRPWAKAVWDSLGLNAEERTSPIWSAGKSKTVAFKCFDESLGEQIEYEMPNPQYVLYCRRDAVRRDERASPEGDHECIVKKIERELPPFPEGDRHPDECIGFCKVSGIDELLVVVDTKKRNKDKEPTSFIIVALFRKGDLREDRFTIDKSEIFGRIKVFLDVDLFNTDPPRVPPSDERSRRPQALLLYEKAESIWKELFTRSTVVTKERFEDRTGIERDSYSLLTRFENCVEKEDWYKFCLFLCSCRDPQAIRDNQEELKEAIELTKNKVLHFSLMTMVDNYSLSASDFGGTHVDIIPAFRLWRYSFYQLFVSAPSVPVHKFFLCKHHAGDPFIYQYNPYSDCIKLLPPSLPVDKKDRKFFYIVPIEDHTEAVTSEYLPVFDSLGHVYKFFLGDDSCCQEVRFDVVSG